MADTAVITLRRRLGNDDGRITIWFAVLAPAFLALIGLVVDGGAKVRAYQRADNIAAEAARAGGQAINVGQAIDGGAKEIDASMASTAIEAYLGDLDGVTGTVIVDDAQQLTVTVNVTYNPILLDLFGGGAGTTVTGRATATLIAQ
ncbi:TadE/TadG family type IV pilus assembly protein [Micromonospora sp. NPDC049171]|uniref:TadE/TadG family type IV pilus assembly protein n=1 Tax=Micromonospora sp. NPDC049171 TaxID=3155770 RepID=UPI0033F9EDAF